MTEPDNNQLPLFELDPASSASTNAPSPATRETPFSKYIVYVDESGDHNLQTIDEGYPIFVLAFCVFHKRYYSEHVVSALEKFKFNYFGHDQIILHENDIRKEKEPFNIFRSREEKDQFLNVLTDVIDQSNFILMSCAIDKRTFPKQTGVESNPYNIALGFCLETLYEFLQEKHQHEKRTHVVVERRGKKEDNELELEFRRICARNNRLAMPLPFEVIFSDKKVMSTGLQLADLVARPIGLNILRPEQENRAFEVLKKKFYCEGGREQVGNNYEGVGMKIFPNT